MSKVIGRNDPCACGSGKKYKRCCGQGHGLGFAAPIFMTDIPTKRYFVMNPTMSVVMRDEQGRILVFTDRARAGREAETRKFVEGGAVAIIGMGDEKWARFQAAEPHVLLD